MSFTEHPHKLFHISLLPRLLCTHPQIHAKTQVFNHVISLFVGVCITTVSSPDSSEGFKIFVALQNVSPLSSVTYITHHSSTPGERPFHLSYSKHPVHKLSPRPIQGSTKSYTRKLHNLQRYHLYITRTTIGGQS